MKYFILETIKNWRDVMLQLKRAKCWMFHSWKWDSPQYWQKVCPICGEEFYK